MHSNQLTPGTLVQHYKGGRYVIVGSAQHTETAETLVLYRREGKPGGTLWARPATMFHEQVKADGGTTPRFKRIATGPEEREER